MNHFLLRLLSAGIEPALRGRRIGAVRVLPPVLSIELRGEGEIGCAVVILSAPGPFCYFDRVDPLGGLGTGVLRRIDGLSVTGVEVPSCDRVIRFELGGSGVREKVVLAVSLFASAAKVRVESRGSIVESLDPKESGRPSPPERSWDGASFSTAGDSALARLLAFGEAPERKVAGMTRELLERFTTVHGSVDVEALVSFRDGVLRGEVPFVLDARGRAGAIVPLPFVPSVSGENPASPGIAGVYGPFTDAETACREVGESIVLALRDDVIARRASPLNKLLSNRQRLLSALEQQQRNADSWERWRNEANVLAAYQSRIPPGASEVTLPDLYGSGSRTIALDPSMSIPEQIKRRFKQAAKLERSRAAVEKRKRTVAGEIERIEHALAQARGSDSLGGAVAAIDECGRRSGIGPRAPKTQRVRSETKELRRFDLDEQWFVLVGRNDRENDEITFRIASPDDFWLHAQHVAGSHVVLKSRGSPGNPPESILEAAAGIAAHYSKARRASVVPVIFTQRRYVRKFKGSKPGQVTCEREKTMFAEPRLPDSRDE